MENELYTIAFRGVSDRTVNSVTHIINHDMPKASYKDRRDKVIDLFDSGVFANICRFSVAKPRFEDK